METTEQNYGAVTVLRPDGPIALEDAQHFREAIVAAVIKTAGRLCIDASAVAFVDSAGLETLVDLTEQMGETGRALKLCCVTETLRETLEVTGWLHAFELYGDVGACVRSFL